MIRILLIIGVAMAVLSGPVTAKASDQCQEVTASNREHANEGRAHYVFALGCDGSAGYYAVGSETFLGLSGRAESTLSTTDNGESYHLGECPAPNEDFDQDGYTADLDCDDLDPNTYPGATDFCGDGLDQDCSGADTDCVTPPSCISTLQDWKVKYTPQSTGCLSCHTRCTAGGMNGVHPCIEGEEWAAEMNCTRCHSNAHP